MIVVSLLLSLVVLVAFWASGSAQNMTIPNCFCYEELTDARYIASPVGIQNANDGSGRLFLAELRGLIWVFLNDGTKVAEPFVNLTGTDLSVTSAGGLMGFTFHPQYATNGRAYLYYVATPATGGMFQRTSEVLVSQTDPNKLDLSTERVVWDMPIVYPDHLGGQILFGPDGYLYIPIGDEFNKNHTQDITTHMSAVHRIDVDTRTGDLEYGIPPDNPFLGVPGAVPETYAYGLRNPWKSSMDPGNRDTGEGYGRIFMGDVGEDIWEEMDLLAPGANYGWSAWEGPECVNQQQCDEIGPTTAPLITYHHSVGRCVIGGHVYRGTEHPSIEGLFIGADWSVSWFFGMSETSPGVWDWGFIPTCESCPPDQTTEYPNFIYAFGVDEQGELYFSSSDVVDPFVEAGSVFKIHAVDL